MLGMSKVTSVSTVWPATSQPTCLTAPKTQLKTTDRRVGIPDVKNLPIWLQFQVSEYFKIWSVYIKTFWHIFPVTTVQYLICQSFLSFVLHSHRFSLGRHVYGQTKVIGQPFSYKERGSVNPSWGFYLFLIFENKEKHRSELAFLILNGTVTCWRIFTFIVSPWAVEAVRHLPTLHSFPPGRVFHPGQQ